MSKKVFDINAYYYIESVDIVIDFNDKKRHLSIEYGQDRNDLVNNLMQFAKSLHMDKELDE